MSDPGYLIGRYATVVNCGDALWEGVHVYIVKYRAEDSTYEVQATKPLRETHVKSAHLKLYTPAPFLSIYPKAPVLIGSHSMQEIPPGSVVDFSQADPKIRGSSGFISIKGSCRILGALLSTANTIYNNLIVEAGETDVVEFENVFFTSKSLVQSGREWWTVECVSGQIVFRNCTFKETPRAVSMHCRSTARVTFEGCHFTQLFECGVSAGGGEVVMVSCRFASMTGVGMVVLAHARCSLHHCTLHNCTGGVIVPNHGAAVINDCEFEDVIDFCVLASNGSHVATKDCIAVGCKNAAVIVEGRGRTTVTVQGWVVQGANVAMRIGNGSVNVTLHQNIFTDCPVSTYVAIDTVGRVDISQCKLPTCVNVSGDKCTFTHDGVVEPPGTQLKRLYVWKEMHEGGTIRYGYPLSAMGKRVLAEAAALGMQGCTWCKVNAPSSTLHKKCSRCREARYCSRECQVAHWPSHALDCHVMAAGAKMMSTVGYIACDHNKCQIVDAFAGMKNHSACSRCAGVFYCSKRCQKAAWPEHKLTCVPFKK